MRFFITLLIASFLCCFHVSTFAGEVAFYRPNPKEMQQSVGDAKLIFIEAFSTTYTQYHLQSGNSDPIEKWLRLKPGQTLQSWLSRVFDEEYEEYLAGTKNFIYLSDSNGQLIGFLSHSPVSEKGEVYLSLLALAASHRNQKIATQLLKADTMKQLFPSAKEFKVITRKINAIAQRLYTHAGFIMDETIDPAVYGDSYDDRYIGFRLTLE